MPPNVSVELILAIATGFTAVLSMTVFFSTGSFLASVLVWLVAVLIVLVLWYYNFIDITAVGTDLLNFLTNPLGTPAPTIVPLTKIQKVPVPVPVPVAPAIPKSGPEVFHIEDSQFTYDDAPAVCAAYGAQLATYEQISDAFNNGAEWCGYGWSAGGMALFPTQRSTWLQLQQEVDQNKRTACGRPGVNGGYMDPNTKFGVNCYGIKPGNTQGIKLPTPLPTTDQTEFQKAVDRFKKMINKFTVDPYSRISWSQYFGGSYFGGGSATTAVSSPTSYGSQFAQPTAPAPTGTTGAVPQVSGPVAPSAPVSSGSAPVPTGSTSSGASFPITTPGVTAPAAPAAAPATPTTPDQPATPPKTGISPAPAPAPPVSPDTPAQPVPSVITQSPTESIPAKPTDTPTITNIPTSNWTPPVLNAPAAIPVAPLDGGLISMPADIPKAPGEVTTTFFDPLANAKAQAEHDADQAAVQANIDKYNAEQAAAQQAEINARVAENEKYAKEAAAAQQALWEETKKKYGDVYDPNFNANILKNAVNYSTTDEQAAAKQQADLNAMVQAQQDKDAADLKRAQDLAMSSKEQQAAVQEANDRYNKVVADIAAGNPNPTQETGYTSSGMYGQDSTPVNPDGGSTGEYGKNMYTTGGYQFGPQVGKNEVTGLSAYDLMMQNMSSGGGAPVTTTTTTNDGGYYGGGSSVLLQYTIAPPRDNGPTMIPMTQQTFDNPYITPPPQQQPVDGSGGDIPQVPTPPVDNTGLITLDNTQQFPLTSMPGASPPPGYGSEAFTNYYTSPRNTAPGPEVLVKFLRQFIR
jgi:hypothetical protein